MPKGFAKKDFPDLYQKNQPIQIPPKKEESSNLSSETAPASGDGLSPEQREQISNINPAPQSPRVSKPRVKKMQEQEIPDAEYTKILSGFKVAVRIAMEYGAELTPVKIPVSEMEKELMSESLELVLNKYKPQLIQSAPEFMLGTAMVMFLVPRFWKQKNEAPAERIPEPEQMQEPDKNEGALT